MDELKISDIGKFIKAVSDPLVAPFIDLKKVCQSDRFKLSVQMATQHAIKHGDVSYLNQLLDLVKDSVHADDLIAAVRPHFNFVLTETLPRRFMKATAEQVAHASKRDLSNPAAPRRKAKPVRRDLMDSHLMLPGSYGHGKRR